MSPSATADVRDVGGRETAAVAEPSLADLMESAYMLVAIASPPRPSRRRIEWLVGCHERAARAIDVLVARGLLVEVGGDEPRLVLGEAPARERDSPSRARIY